MIKFRPVTISNDTTQYTDAITTLADHPLVSITGPSTDATLHPRGAVDIEIKIASTDPSESYIPLGIIFEQKQIGSSQRQDPHGKTNFGHVVLNGSSLTVHDSFARIGKEYDYEFSVVIQRGSDGKIGIIDPGMVHDNSDARLH